MDINRSVLKWATKELYWKSFSGSQKVSG